MPEEREAVDELEWVDDGEAAFEDGDGRQVERAFERLLDAAVGRILETQDSDVFLEWMRDEAPQLFPELFEGLPDEASRRGFALQYGYALWNVTPLPAHGYRPRPLPRPERNGACPCGSGKKYKKCCADLPELPPLPPEYAWTAVLEHLPLEEVASLAAGGRVPRLLLAEVGERLLETRQPERARELLEGLFERPERWEEGDADALDVLFDAYEELGDSEAKRKAVLRLVPDLPPVLRSLLWERLALSLAGEEDMAGAWDAFERAREEDPESPSLGPVEVSLLLVEERTEEAADCARGWLSRAAKSRRPVSPDGIALLEEVAEDPDRALLGLILDDRLPLLDRLIALVGKTAEAPAYEAVPVEGRPGSFTLATPASLLALEERWHETALPLDVTDDEADDLEEGEGLEADPLDDVEDDFGDEDVALEVWDGETSERWIAFLEDNPEALSDLSILDDLSEIFEELTDEVGARLDRELLWPFARLGPQVVERALAGREDAELPWSEGINRSVQRLYWYAADVAERMGDVDEERRLLSRLLAFDPDDPHDVRARLQRGE